ncbi:MAG: DUF2061 domain-containing protein [Bacteroidales bacterium]|nr:DUF2061 domain-containing protein [Bacteroidales bacterium]
MANSSLKQKTQKPTFNSETISNIYETKDSPTRSLLKALSWRLIASTVTFIIVFIIFRQVTDKSIRQAFESASYVAFIDIIAKLIFYYFHERMWTNISWGKYWRRPYWRRRAWKKLYRKMHD